MRLVSAKEILTEYQISYTTLHRWREEGKIKFKKLSDRKILYDIESFLPDNIDNRKNVIYGRVSSSIQKEQLSTQIETVKNYMFNNGIQCDEVYSDIGSGMSCNRNDFKKLIKDIIAGNIKVVYISFKDRLTRFGYDYFKFLFEQFNTEIKVLDENEETNSTYQKELTEDLISIIHYYSMKIYSSRRKRLKEIEKILEEDK